MTPLTPNRLPSKPEFGASAASRTTDPANTNTTSTSTSTTSTSVTATTTSTSTQATQATTGTTATPVAKARSGKDAPVDVPGRERTKARRAKSGGKSTARLSAALEKTKSGSKDDLQARGAQTARQPATERRVQQKTENFITKLAGKLAAGNAKAPKTLEARYKLPAADDGAAWIRLAKGTAEYGGSKAFVEMHYDNLIAYVKAKFTRQDDPDEVDAQLDAVRQASLNTSNSSNSSSASAVSAQPRPQHQAVGAEGVDSYEKLAAFVKVHPAHDRPDERIGQLHALKAAHEARIVLESVPVSDADIARAARNLFLVVKSYTYDELNITESTRNLLTAAEKNPSATSLGTAAGLVISEVAMFVADYGVGMQ